MDNYFYHHGIKGMRWGIRKYQNKDGSLTDLGKKRYARDAREQNWEIGKDGIARSRANKTKGEIREADPNKWVREDRERVKDIVDSSSGMVNQLKKANEFTDKVSKNHRKETRMDLSNMTDREMRTKINRELLERQYNSVFNPEKVSTGRQYVSEILEGAGVVLGVTSSAITIALGIQKLRGK